MKKCPRIEFRIVENTAASFSAQAIIPAPKPWKKSNWSVTPSAGSHKLVGDIIVLEEKSDLFSVSGVGVAEEYQRCGIGTKLYELAAKYTCNKNLSLYSDVLLSKFSHAFWTKQVKKGRAVCVMQQPYHISDDPIENCRRFKLIDSCPKTLEGPKAKLRKRKR